MKFFAQLTIASGLVAAAPANEILHIRAAATSILPAATNAPAVPRSPLKINIGNIINPGAQPIPPLLQLEAGRASSVSRAASSSITQAPESSRTYATVFPSTFSAPVRGVGVLALDNLPALPPVLDKSLSGVLGAAYGLMSGVCNEDHKCSITISGSIESLLVDGDQYGTETSISAWCDNGRCFGTADRTLNATAPFEITCDRLTGTSACSGTIAGLARAVFMNGKQVELWGWFTPSGYCLAGLCQASFSAFGDPMY